MSAIDLRPGSEFTLGIPGVYLNVPEDVYHGFDAVSNSRLSKLRISAKHCKTAIDKGFAPTKSTDFGGASHASILQPMEFMKNYAVAGQCSAKIKSGDQCSKGGSHRVDGKWYCSTSGHSPGEGDGVSVVSAGDYLAIQSMQREVMSHPVAKAALDCPGGFEVSLLWRHDGTGLLVKNRLDFISILKKIMIDYKTTRDASVWGFSKSIGTFGYHRQGYLYRKGCEVLGMSDFDFAFIAQEKADPFMAMVYRLSDAAVEAGRIEVEESYEDGLGERVEKGLIYHYDECVKSGVWNGWKNDSAVMIDLPEYMYKTIFEEAA